MKIIHLSHELSLELSAQRKANKKIAFVPTMGALHDGHVQLVKEATQANHYVVVSIFVNPLQFNNPTDFNTYPITLENDYALLRAQAVDAVFVPDYEQVYQGTAPQKFELGALDLVMEGKFRPGHFQGVANVVYRLFKIVNPDFAYFGLKDYQQLLVIQKIVDQHFNMIQIIGVPTSRDKNGLAQSSRNMRLSPAQYQQALIVPPLLQQLPERLLTQSFFEISQWIHDEVNAQPELRLEYFQIADAHTLEIMHTYSATRQWVACIAFYAGPVRLIDNVFV